MFSFSRLTAGFLLCAAFIIGAPSISISATPGVIAAAWSALSDNNSELKQKIAAIQAKYLLTGHRLRCKDTNGQRILQLRYINGSEQRGKFVFDLVCYYSNYFVGNGMGVTETTIAIEGEILNGKTSSLKISNYPDYRKFEEFLNSLR